MEFRFNLNEIFADPIVEIGSNLIPPGFSGDKRALWDTQSKITQIVNAMGEASAGAQGLSKPITTADRLRNSEHKLYLLIDKAANGGRGAVTGMLKTGEKGLYVFDRDGQHYKVSPPCVLDFYIHESRQRAGHGKNLFEHMLQKQQIEPVKMAIDRPSDKLLGFFNKHYGLNAPVKQMNNYVVYDGFFPRPTETPRTVEGDKSYAPGKKQSANGLQHGVPTSPYGRYAARRPPCSMGQIIHNDSAVIKRSQEPTGVRSEPVTNVTGQHGDVCLTSNQPPAWQATQSVPNMAYAAYYHNQPNYSQPPQQQEYAQNQHSYPYSSGDYAPYVECPQLRQPAAPTQVPAVQDLNQERYDQNCVQNYQRDYHNYTMGQGDATGHSYKNRNGVAATTQQMDANHTQYLQMSNANESAQAQPQVFTCQGQNYCYNPQTQQYQMIADQYRQNNVPQQQMYHSSMPVQANTVSSTSQEVPYYQQVVPQPRRKPLRPQCFDGTVRRVQQSISMPAQITGAQQKQALSVHGTSSAPISYQHQAIAIPRHPNAFDPGNVQNAASITHQASNQYEANVSYSPNQIAAHKSQTLSSHPHGDDRNAHIGNMAQSPEAAISTRSDDVVVPSQETGMPHPNQVMSENQVNQHNTQMHSSHTKNVHQTLSMSQIVANQNESVQRQDQTIGNTSVGYPTNPNQSPPVSNMSQRGDDQNVTINRSFNVDNTAQVSQDTNLRIPNAALSSDQLANQLNSHQMMTQPFEVHQPSNNQMLMHNIQSVPSRTQAPNMERNIAPQQQQFIQQGRNPTSQHTAMNMYQYENVVGQQSQPNVHRRLVQANDGFPHEDNVKNTADQDTNRQPRQCNKEFDYSQGYPPHNPNSVATRPRIIVRN